MKVQLVKREVLNPLGEVKSKKKDINPIPDDFEVVSLVDNTKPGAEVILNTLKEALGNREFIKVKKPAGAPATPPQIEKAASAELALLALGDCGSCSSWVVLDAIRLEEKGIPTISIFSDTFVPFARELAAAHGAEGLRILEIEHPVAGIPEEEVTEKALKIVPSFLYLLQIP